MHFAEAEVKFLKQHVLTSKDVLEAFINPSVGNESSVSLLCSGETFSEDASVLRAKGEVGDGGKPVKRLKQQKNAKASSDGEPIDTTSEAYMRNSTMFKMRLRRVLFDCVVDSMFPRARAMTHCDASLGCVAPEDPLPLIVPKKSW